MKAERIAAQAAAVAGRRKRGDRAEVQKARDVVGPVIEQSMQFTDTPQPVRTEKGQVVGRAYRRRYLFETFAKLPAAKDDPTGPRMIQAHELRALKFYRAAWEGMQSSEMRCALDVDSVRGGVPSGIPALVGFDYRVRECDRAMGAIGDTMRAVALHDQSFSDVAMVRFGSRDRQRIVVGSGRRRPRVINEVVPRSGRHREIVRDEFYAALAVLVATVERLTEARG